MRAWSPDELLDEARAAVFTAPDSTAGFPDDGRSQSFVADYPADGLAGYLKHLDAGERETLFQLAVSEVRGEVAREMRLENEERRRGVEKTTRRLGARLRESVENELHDIAKHATELAIAMAEQVLRRSVELDRSALLRSIETIIFRAERGTRFTVIANPDDAAVLRDHPEMLAGLNIDKVEPDRRVERGGCVITADGREWDYTLGGRFERLSEVVREAMLVRSDEVADQAGQRDACIAEPVGEDDADEAPGVGTTDAGAAHEAPEAKP